VGGSSVTGQEGIPIFERAVSEGATLTDLSSLARNAGQNIGTDEIAQYLTSQGLDPTALGTPNYGLGGAEKALDAAGTTALGYLDQGSQRADALFGQGVDSLTGARERIGQIINQGSSGLEAFMNPGQQANQLQAALSGALGPQAQADAFANFQSSPGVSFLQQQGERALMRNAAARGGLGGGNLSRDLVEYGQGLALQDLTRQTGQLGELSQRGAGVAGVIASLRGQQAGLEGGLGRDIANLKQNQAGLTVSQAQTKAGVSLGLGRDAANMRFRTGQDMASIEAGASSALAELIQNQGRDINQAYGSGS
jgi:hypothetical protein